MKYHPSTPISGYCVEVIAPLALHCPRAAGRQRLSLARPTQEPNRLGQGACTTSSIVRTWWPWSLIRKEPPLGQLPVPPCGPMKPGPRLTLLCKLARIQVGLEGRYLFCSFVIRKCCLGTANRCRPSVSKTMPMQLLERLSCLQLPVKIRESNDIENCEVLRNAAFIEADLPPRLHGRGTSKFSGQAIVMKVTEAGLCALRRRRASLVERPAAASAQPSRHVGAPAAQVSIRS